jgi:hypothetical protein
MLATLPKLADKAFILGFFLPTFLLVLAVAGLFHDQPWGAKVLAVASQKDGWDTLAYFVLAVWGVAVLLMMANHMQLQILEGYRWPVSKMSVFRRREEKRFEGKKARADQLTEQWKTQDDKFSEDGKRELARLLRELVHEFPPDVGDHLPTRLGNAIRAFEVYSSKVYGADSIPLWLHLSTVISADFQSALDDARAQVNGAVNSVSSLRPSVFSLLHAFSAVLNGIFLARCPIQGISRPLYSTTRTAYTSWCHWRRRSSAALPTFFRSSWFTPGAIW